MTTLISVDTALSHVLERALPVQEAESADLHHALGRILSEDLQVRHDIPSADNTSVDGYALRLADLQDDRRLPVSARIPAGTAPEPLAPGTCARIFTGANIPEGADTVVMQEDVEVEDELRRFPEGLRAGDNIRRRGQDLRQGDTALHAGTRLRAQELGLIASLGLAQVPVWRRLRVAVLTTGDELVEPGQPLPPGRIFNTNRFTLQAMLQQLDCEVVVNQTVPDNHDATAIALKRAARQADLIVTSGGVSVGEEDHLRAVLEQHGQLSLWRMAMKPGKPLAFGAIGNIPVLGLPGNPASVLVTGLIICVPFIRRCQGDVRPAPRPIRLPAAFSVDKASIRREYVRARQELRDGHAVVSCYPNQSSGLLSSACWADGLAVVPENQTLAEGDMIDYYPFSDLLG
ncbi:MAG: molybdopterin molybdotransferase MoeA [Marinobacter sp.]|uniref:molybdopterin molybdotransferase MoeA n=1 Tax=Marinobacter sp. TaxID=50741 RepID=UPI00299D89A9|nr:gephyrin-like molybdotransferase Glp [Marinobacter sp.]MDX1633211.1 molybdopterin molybdotransferase MoeA [Marinobacter sp.]